VVEIVLLETAVMPSTKTFMNRKGAEAQRMINVEASQSFSLVTFAPLRLCGSNNPFLAVQFKFLQQGF
jgi:hypothetical protein